jgi:molecular chaperone GrpE
MPSSHASNAEEQRAEAQEQSTDAQQRRTDAPEAPQQPEPDGRDGADLSEELARAEDRYKRALADLDNYRKRAAREVQRQGSEVRDRIVLDWLEVIDSVERALRMQPDKPLFDGLRAVLDQIDGVLARQGVQRIGAVGERFDPHRHEAISVRETDELEDHTVLEVARSGFAIGDRVLRPAQVVVSRRPEPEA